MTVHQFSNLVIGIYLELGVWILEFRSLRNLPFFKITPRQQAHHDPHVLGSVLAFLLL